MTRIAIIGAGLSGLSVANLLKDKADVTLFEKARGVSGRMSTRHAKPYYFDHGAQYFTARSEAFQTFIQPLIECGVIKRWNARYVKFDGNHIAEQHNWMDDEPRYVGVPGMNAVAKLFAQNLNIRLNTKITSLKQNGTWQLSDEEDTLYDGFDWVISTVPSPQATELLPETFKYYETVKAVEMRACFALMLGFSQSLSLEFEAAHITNTDVNWLAVNSRKPGRAEIYTLVVHSSENYAEAHFDDPRERVTEHLCSETSRLTGHDVSKAAYKTLHGWRYANNAKREKHPVFIDPDLKLAACGDWCLGGRVENAFTSAYNLVEKLKEYM